MIHEATHAALHLYRLDEWAQPGRDGVVNLGDGCEAEEEAYAHLHGRLAASLLDMVDEIRDRNPWLV